MEFKFEYNKTYLPKEYLDNRDFFRNKITNNINNDINKVDAIMESGIVDSFYINKDGIIFLNFNEDKIKKLVKEWKA